jgi:hypothetical protein
MQRPKGRGRWAAQPAVRSDRVPLLCPVLFSLALAPLLMKKNELLGPEHIGILGADTVMQSANTIPHLVESL